MSEQEQQVLILKGRVFDLTESLSQVRAQSDQFAGVLSTLAQILGIQPDENGSVRIEDIVATVSSLIPAPVQEELPLE